MINNKSTLLLMLLMLITVACNKDEESNGIAIRDDFLGLWQCDEYDQNQQLVRTFQVEIFAHGSNANNILIDNFNLLGQGYQAEASTNSTQVTIPQQVIGFVSVNGSGYITNQLTTIEMAYNVDDGSGQPESIAATLTKI
ncbi:MAG TPA: hypothetical protein EYN38_10910 [Flavobacteriales bacterium]|nr:hypothetical protein [Flavobacteriales bacterium]